MMWLPLRLNTFARLATGAELYLILLVRLP